MRASDFGPAPIDVPDAYPGVWPDGPTVVEGTSVASAPPGTTVHHDRTPMLAYGSNACPAQLVRKGLPGAVLLTPTTLFNHLVVYARHVTTYGAVPATLARWAGASTQVFLVWLTPDQQQVMHDSEGGNYDLVRVPTSDGMMSAYRAHTGLLRIDGGLVRVAGVHADGPSLPWALDQVAVREHLQDIQRTAAGSRVGKDPGTTDPTRTHFKG